MLNRQQKEKIVTALSVDFDEAKTVVFTDYRGIKANEMTALKRELKENDLNLRVVKKKLIDLALKKSKIDISVKDLSGQVALTVSKEDEVISAKILNKFAKSNENLKIIGGLLEKERLEVKEIIALAKLPSKEELLARLVGSLNSPMTGLVNIFQGNQRKLVYALKAIVDNK